MGACLARPAVRCDAHGLGPGADGSFAFNLYEGVPETKFGGVVASGWTVQLTPVLTYTWTIRQGIMFTGNTNIGMAPRALTAADVVYSEQRAMSRSGFAAATRRRLAIKSARRAAYP